MITRFEKGVSVGRGSGKGRCSEFFFQPAFFFQTAAPALIEVAIDDLVYRLVRNSRVYRLAGVRKNRQIDIIGQLSKALRQISRFPISVLYLLMTLKKSSFLP